MFSLVKRSGETLRTGFDIKAKLNLESLNEPEFRSSWEVGLYLQEIGGKCQILEARHEKAVLKLEIDILDQYYPKTSYSELRKAYFEYGRRGLQPTTK